MKTRRPSAPVEAGAIDTPLHNITNMKLLRRRDVCDRLGITRHQLDKLVSTGLIKPIQKRGSRAWYRSTDLEKLA